MSSPSDPASTAPTQPWARRHWRLLLAGGLVLVIAATAAVALAVTRGGRQPTPVPLGLHRAATIPLPGDSSRFDYASLDSGRGLLFIAHLGAGQVIEVDIHTQKVIRTIPDLPGVHGVLVLPDRRRVYATATDANQMVILDEDTGAVLARGATGAYPDGLAYDPVHATVWTTNETGGSETILDAASAAPRGTVELGGQAGNVAYDPTSRQMLVAVQTRNLLAVLDPATATITRRVDLPGCDHDHGLAVDDTDRLAFVACDGNAVLLTLDLNTWQILDHQHVGQDPDVLAYDRGAHRLYIAAESGWLTTLAVHNRHAEVTGSGHLADAAHVVAVDPTTHRSYFPVPHGPDGQPALLVFDPAP
jgi:DNA-binding beta-propeller fold protein YncE